MQEIWLPSCQDSSPLDYFVQGFCKLHIFQPFLDIILPKTPSFQPEVPFLGMNENVPLVLTGVRVTNFLIIMNFDLIFLHNTHILSVCLFVGLHVILFCLSCLSVCLSVSRESREKKTKCV